MVCCVLQLLVSFIWGFSSFSSFFLTILCLFLSFSLEDLFLAIFATTREKIDPSVSPPVCAGWCIPGSVIAPLEDSVSNGQVPGQQEGE